MSAAELQVENTALKQRIQQLEAELASVSAAAVPSEPEGQEWALRLDEYRRYGRQMVMPEVGLEGITSLSLGRRAAN